jgi:hypothetical protein
MKAFVAAVLESIGKIGLTISITMPVRLLATMVNEKRKALTTAKNKLHGTISCCSVAPTATSTSCSAAVGLALWMRGLQLLRLQRFR